MFRLILKLGIHVLSKKQYESTQNYNNYIMGKKDKNTLINLDVCVFSIYNVYLFIQNVLKKNGKILFIEQYFKFSKLIQNLAKNNSQNWIVDKNWIGGTLTNFSTIRWYYYLKGIYVGNKLPEIIIVFDHLWYKNILNESKLRRLPVIGSLNFTNTDIFLDYYVVGNFENFNSVCFFTKIIDLAIKNGRNKKIKKSLQPLNTGKSVFKKKRKWKKKRGQFIRTFMKQVFRLKVFRPKLEKNARRLNLIRKIVSFYYDWTRRKKKNPRVLKKTPVFFKKRTSNKIQNFIASYEKRLTTVLYRLKMCKDRDVAKYFIEKSWVFVNNKVITRKNYVIKNNDVIQINFFEYRCLQIKKFLKKYKKVKKQNWKKKRKARIKLRKISGKIFRKKIKKVRSKKISFMKFWLTKNYKNKIKKNEKLNNWITKVKNNKRYIQKKKAKIWRINKKLVPISQRKNKLVTWHYNSIKSSLSKKNIQKLLKNKNKPIIIQKNLFELRPCSFKNKLSLKSLQKYKWFSFFETLKFKKDAKKSNLQRRLKRNSKIIDILKKKNNQNPIWTEWITTGFLGVRKGKKLSKFSKINLSKNFNNTFNKKINDLKFNNQIKKNKRVRNLRLLKFKILTGKTLSRKRLIKKLKMKIRRKRKKWVRKKRFWWKLKRVNKRRSLSRKLKRKNYPRNFFLNKKYGIAIYVYTPNTQKILIGRFLTFKRLKVISHFNR